MVIWKIKHQEKLIFTFFGSLEQGFNNEEQKSLINFNGHSKTEKVIKNYD